MLHKSGISFTPVIESEHNVGGDYLHHQTVIKEASFLGDAVAKEHRMSCFGSIFLRGSCFSDDTCPSM